MSNCEATPKRRCLIESSCLFTNKEENPFSNLHIKDSSFLNEISKRGICPKCNKSRRYYCYECYVAVAEISDWIPKVKLPVKVDIIKHPKEVDGKSTSAHAAVLAPEDVRIFTYPDFPSYEGKKVVLIFPGKGAATMEQILSSSHSLEDRSSDSNQLSCCTVCSCSDKQKLCCVTKSWPFDRVVFIDSTWRQTKKLYNDPRIRNLPCAVLTSHKSVFWRHQRDKPESYLSTIEAIYYFFVELHQLTYPDVQYCGYCDNLLFFFKFMYHMIRTLYDPATLKAYQQM